MICALRHADGSQHPFALNCAILPERISGLDQRNLPVASPRLQLLLARDCTGHVVRHLEMDQALHAMALGETFDLSRAMLLEPRHQIARNADVQRAMPAASQNIDAGVAAHDLSLREWMLNQVQHDEIGPRDKP